MRFNSQQKNKLARKHESLELKQRGFHRKGSYYQNKNLGCFMDKSLQRSRDNKLASPANLGKVLGASVKQVQIKGDRDNTTSVCIHKTTCIPENKKYEWIPPSSFPKMLIFYRQIHNSLIGLGTKDSF